MSYKIPGRREGVALQWRAPNWNPGASWMTHWRSSKPTSEFVAAAGASDANIIFSVGSIGQWYAILDQHDVVKFVFSLHSDGWNSGTLGTANGLLPVAFRPRWNRSVNTSHVYTYHTGHQHIVVNFWVDIFPNGNVTFRAPSSAMGDVFGNLFFVRYQK